MTGVGRTQQQFPTRQYPHGYRGGGPAAFTAPLVAGRTYRFITGRDDQPAPLAAADPGVPQDLFAGRVLLGPVPAPTSLRALRTVLDGIPELSQERSFIVADGGQIPWSQATDAVERSFRVLVVRQGPGADQPAVLVSASSDFDSDTNFLQVIGWDAEAGAYQFYDRREGIWFWAGSSWDALEDDTRGKGPFDSHVNGGLNMKELKPPWIHWHSQASPILDGALAPDDPLRLEPLWTGRRQAEEFERTVARPGIARWTEARFTRSITQSRLQHLPRFLRQVVTTTTINLVSSPTSKGALAGATGVPLPITFFFNADALLGAIGLEPAVTPPRVPAAVYREMLVRYAVGLTDRPDDTQFRFPGDTHFLFVVPEPALEDLNVLEGLLARGVLSPKLAASLLMVDFCNVIYSPRRAALLRYVPLTAAVGNPADLDRAFITAVEASTTVAGVDSAERELLDNWSLPDATWRRTFAERIEAFMAGVAPRLRTPNDFAPIFELAESRRRELRRFKLHEFRLTTPITSITEQAPYLEFDLQGGVRPKPERGRTIMAFDPPGFVQDLDQAGRDGWSKYISDALDFARTNGSQPGSPSKYGPRLQFFNSAVTPPSADAVTKDISWSAFPRMVQLQSMTDLQRWRTADSSRDVQDEYCEWSVARDPNTDKITRVTFTSEPREYWNYLARVNPATLLALYRRHISPQVQMTDLIQQGRYQGRNRWNNSTTNGAMHLIQQANSLGAEIELAAAATIVRTTGGQIITDTQELIRCGAYGERERHSDPFIGASVNELARAKADITLENPVGLYLGELSVAGWATPDGSNPLDYWTIERGTREKAVRAAYEVPGSKGFLVGDITIGGRPIAFGAQIADFIRVKLTGVATRIGQSTVQPFNGCVGSTGFAAPPVALSLADLLDDSGSRAVR